MKTSRSHGDSSRRGAAGFVTKSDSPECMLRAIERVCQGDFFLSPYLASQADSSNSAENGVAELSLRDRRIIELLGDGKSLSEISYELGQVTRRWRTSRTLFAASSGSDKCRLDQACRGAAAGAVAGLGWDLSSVKVSMKLGIGTR